MELADRAWLWVLVPLWLLWAAAFLLLRTVGVRRRLAGAALRFSSLSTLQRLAPSTTLLLRRMAECLRLLSVALLVVAIARPQVGRTETKVHTEGIDIMLVLDTSGSMDARDLDSQWSMKKRRNRLQVAQAVVDKFIAGRPDDEIGMVVFGEQAFTQCPLTLDHGVVSAFLNRLAIGMAGDSTAIGSALGTAVKRLTKAKAKSKVVVLLTDGQNNTGDLSPRKAAEAAKTLGVKVYTIGVGTRGKAPFLIQHPLFGEQVIYREEPIDEETLQEIAAKTGGSYFRAEDAAALQEIYDRINALERTKIEMNKYTEYDERFAWFVIPSILLLCAELLLLGTRLRKIP